MNKARGDAGERLAWEYLQTHGFRLCERNYRFHHGEIDIIAEEGDVLVFCEVKTRANERFGLPEQAVGWRKQRQIRRIAQAYLTVRHIRDRVCRFDVVAVTLVDGVARIHHIRDAFR